MSPSVRRTGGPGMRTAHKVWSGIAAGVFCLVAITDLSGGDTAATTSTASTAGSAVTAPTTSSRSAVTAMPSATPAPPAASVSRVLDGDTVELSDGREVRLIGLDACDLSTPGGLEAKASLESLASGRSVQLVREGSRDTDAKGRLLRRVETVAYGAGTDLGTLMISQPSVGPEDGQGASAGYLTELRNGDDGARTCTAPPTTSSSSSSGSSSGDASDLDLDGPTPGDQGLPDGALTGGYCKKKWWC